MSRALIVVRSTADRQRASKWCLNAPYGCRIDFKETKRSIPQNDKLWAMLSDVAAQKEHGGKKYRADTWKMIFMHAWGHEVQFIPSLTGDGFIPMGFSSSDLSKNEMSELIEFVIAWAAQNGVTLHNDEVIVHNALDGRTKYESGQTE